MLCGYGAARRSRERLGAVYGLLYDLSGKISDRPKLYDSGLGGYAEQISGYGAGRAPFRLGNVAQVGAGAVAYSEGKMSHWVTFHTPVYHRVHAQSTPRAPSSWRPPIGRR